MEKQIQIIKSILEEILEKLTVQGEINVIEGSEFPQFVIRTQEAGILIGENGKHLIALLDKIEDRDQAESQVNRKIAIYRDQLPELSEDEFYWTDLLGLTVQLEDGMNLGTVRYMLATGANDVMVVQGVSERERLIPFVLGTYVLSVDLDNGLIVVDWDPDF